MQIDTKWFYLACAFLVTFMGFSIALQRIAKALEALAAR